MKHLVFHMCFAFLLLCLSSCSTSLSIDPCDGGRCNVEERDVYVDSSTSEPVREVEPVTFVILVHASHHAPLPKSLVPPHALTPTQITKTVAPVGTFAKGAKPVKRVSANAQLASPTVMEAVLALHQA